jgi:hypothetical protein
MTRQLLRIGFCVLLLVTACSDDPPDEISESVAAADDPTKEVQTTTTTDATLDGTTDDADGAQVVVLDGIAQFNSGLPIPSLWGIQDNESPEFDGGGISFYRFAPDATSLAMAMSNSCAQVLLDIEPTAEAGISEAWIVTRVLSVDSTCDTLLTEMFDAGDQLLIDVFDQQAMVFGTPDTVLFAAMFESFSDQGDPRRDPAGAIVGRTSNYFG